MPASTCSSPPRIADVVGPRMVERDTAGLSLLHVEEPTFTGPQRLAKEVFDRVGAALALVVLAPVFLAVAVAVKLDSRGPVFFRQTRVGRDGRPFSMVKFRTMVVGAERLRPTSSTATRRDGLLFKLRTDPRVTRVGRWLRRYSVDELPQLVNVLRGRDVAGGAAPAAAARGGAVRGPRQPAAAGQAGHHGAVAGERPLGSVRGTRPCGSTSTTSTTGRRRWTSRSSPRPSRP